MPAFASGKNAWGISDRSGRRYLLKDMRREWNGLLVGPDEFEAKHPQLELRQNVTDPQALRDPRPARAEPVAVYPGQPALPGDAFTPLLLTTAVGSVTTEIGA